VKRVAHEAVVHRGLCRLDIIDRDHGEGKGAASDEATKPRSDEARKRRRRGGLARPSAAAKGNEATRQRGTKAEGQGTDELARAENLRG